ncbi:MAG: YdcF family protein [Archangium sp.]|nr:YdcF family protein [Archangium sp.]
MFYLLSKTLDLLLEPLWVGGALGLLGLALIVRKRVRAGVGVMLSAFVLVLAFSLPWVADGLWATLERGVVATQKQGEHYDLIILLGGVVDPPGTSADEEALGEAAERLTRTFELLQQGVVDQVLITGTSPTPGVPSEAELVSKRLQRWGIAADRILQEPKARSTRENARFTAELLGPTPPAKLLLITSVFHLPRALACFESAGLHPDTVAVDYRMREPHRESSLVPRAEALHESTKALRELAGRVVYAAVGCAR